MNDRGHDQFVNKLDQFLNKLDVPDFWQRPSLLDYEPDFCGLGHDYRDMNPIENSDAAPVSTKYTWYVEMYDYTRGWCAFMNRLNGILLRSQKQTTRIRKLPRTIYWSRIAGTFSTYHDGMVYSIKREGKIWRLMTSNELGKGLIDKEYETLGAAKQAAIEMME